MITQVSTVNSLINFITGEQMLVALTAIGDNHFRTAGRVLGNLPHARDQAALLRIGICHLEGAHIAYQKQWDSVLTGIFRPYSYATACKKDVYTCCLLAACYAYLKEEQLVHLALYHAERAQQNYIETGADFDETFSPGRAIVLGQFWDIPAIYQLRRVPKVSLPDYKNNLLRILPELCNR